MLAAVQIASNGHKVLVDERKQIAESAESG